MKNPMDRWLEIYPPSGDSRKPGEDPPPPRLSPKMQARLPVDDEIDLHGLTAAEAETRLNGFLAEALREGCRKVLIIHGKGRRSPGERPVLKELVRQIIKNWAWTDYWGTADPPQGGEGASWVILKTTGPGR